MYEIELNDNMEIFIYSKSTHSTVGCSQLSATWSRHTEYDGLKLIVCINFSGFPLSMYIALYMCSYII